MAVNGNRVQHNQLAFGQLGRQRGLQRQLTDLLVQIVSMAAKDRTEDRGAATELR
jgi:hypothetical protein